MGEGKNHTDYETRHAKQQGRYKISPDKPSQRWGKILEKVLINRINHHIFSTEFLNINQYGFIPQTSKIEAIIAVKEFVQEGFAKGEITVTIRLDVEVAFNSAWVPRVLQNLKESGFPRNLYNRTKNYFTQRKANMATNYIKIERLVNKGCPQGSCLGPGLWNTFYNSLLNLELKSSTKNNSVRR